MGETATQEKPPISNPTARPMRAFIYTDIRHGGTLAYYAEVLDYVRMPPIETFRDAESHAATLDHELVHWTKHNKRLARDLGRIRHSDEGYAKEELVAELGAVFLSADLGITPEVQPAHAAYIGSWLKVLANDKRFILLRRFTHNAPRTTCTRCNHAEFCHKLTRATGQRWCRTCGVALKQVFRDLRVTGR